VVMICSISVVIYMMIMSSSIGMMLMFIVRMVSGKVMMIFMMVMIMSMIWKFRDVVVCWCMNIEWFLKMR